MSGHSKWSTIKRKKGAADAKRGAIFTRLSKDITLTARDSGGNPDMNPSLRLAIKKAKAANMPVANIERAIKKGTGDLPGIKYDDIIYECYGPNGVAIILECLTDNKKRTVSEIKNILTKSGGNLGESGCVNWMFEKKGTIVLSKNDVDEDMIFDLDIEDFSIEENQYILTVEPEKFGSISNILEQKNINIDGEVGLVPKNTVEVNNEYSSKILNLIEQLDSHDDIQKVHSNFEII
ncbi:MAG: YebC/PmpR family DNA-binding transcriptional regulator [Candidatus Marinimicrobia bacterium]|nr:YebC/PmpR family DNA-binding transcriptional regulator [Candidatus Neomarinimicrobiota bacterium]|tara:strand:- start:994 stop:1701 length:708 start_codon:yes stop_codon:yes gene_type:complete